jgi:hypothetical protein
MLAAQFGHTWWPSHLRQSVTVANSRRRNQCFVAVHQRSRRKVKALRSGLTSSATPGMARDSTRTAIKNVGVGAQR